MRTSSTLICGAVAAVAVAGSANAAIVWSGLQSATVGTGANDASALVLTSGGSFQKNPDYDLDGNPLFVAYGNFTTGSYGTSPIYAQVGMQGMTDDGSNGTFRFQVYGNLAANVRTVVNNAFGTSISGLSSTLAYNGTTAGSGFALGNNSGSYNSYRLNGGSPAAGGQGGQFKNATGYIGFRFSTDSGTSWFYGWAKYSGADNGASGTLSEWAYNNTAGGSITAGQVPAPGAAALIGLAGLVARRRKA